MIDHFLDSCDYPFEKEPTLSSMELLPVQGTSIHQKSPIPTPSRCYSQGARYLARLWLRAVWHIQGLQYLLSP